MSPAIYYVLGSGNSLRVAQALKRCVPDSHLVPIIRLMSQDIIKTTAEKVGLVFPNFCMTIPIPLHDFIR